MNDDLFGEALESLGSIPQQMGQQAKGVPQNVAQAVISQIKPGGNQPQPASDSSSAQLAESSANSAANKDQAKEDLKLFYGDVPPMSAEQLKTQKQESDTTTKQSLEAARQQLHDQFYYIPLTTPTPEPEKQERPQERVDRLEMEDLQDKQIKEQEKGPDLATQRAQTNAERKIAGAG